jgi:Glycosyltransferase Family 4
MKILIANATLATRTGTETYVRDLALGLLRRGHEPLVYAPQLGEIARELQSASVTVVDDLRNVSMTPDVIHANHNTELMTALLYFPDVPAVFFCHSATDWNSSPPAHPRIVGHVAVDDACRDRLTVDHAIPEERVRVCLHGVDQERFKPRPPLPEKPRRALVFSNNANGFTHLAAVQEACDRAGISLDVVGSSSRSSSSQPESVLGDYDVVFAKARCALESLVVGTSVVLCDARGSGPMVTTRDLERLRQLNFGIRTLSQETTPEVLLREIERYDATDAAEVSRRVRASANLSAVIDDAISTYQQVIDEYRDTGPADPVAESRATADHMRWLTLTMRRNEEALQAMLANSTTLRLRNALGRFAPFDLPLRRLGGLARRIQDDKR